MTEKITEHHPCNFCGLDTIGLYVFNKWVCLLCLEIDGRGE